MTLQGKWLGVIFFSALAVGIIAGENPRDAYVTLCFMVTFLLTILNHKD